MEMMVSTEDMNYLAQQSSDRISMILAGMTSLMSDTDQKVAVMESQTWYQRMAKTITGKNKLSKEEIQQNHDKLNAYMSQAMTELYNRDCINQEIMMSLGTQINELYADHLQLKQMLGAFVTKLNEKIESIDNFHMLNTEIEQGVYSGYEAIVAICLVMSQMDKRILEDNRKLDILKRSMQNQGILEQPDMMLTDFLLSIINMPDDKVGLIYMELGSIPENFVAKLVLDTIESYHFLPDMAKKMKNKNSVVTSIIENNQLDDGIALNIFDVYNDFMESKCNLTYVSIETEIEDEKISKGRIYPDKSNVTELSDEDFIMMSLDLICEDDEELEEESCKEKLGTLEKYAEMGDAYAQYNLGYAYVKAVNDGNSFFSIYRGRNEKLGHEYIEKAAQQGFLQARYDMAEYYAKNGNKQKAIMILEEVIADSEEGCAYDLYLLIELICEWDVEEYLKNTDNKRDEEMKVMELLEKCVALNYDDALYMMALVYKLGTMEHIGYKKSIKEYKRYLEQAVSLGQAEAIYELAMNYNYGDNGYPENKKYMMKYIERSELEDNEDACFFKGLMYLNGSEFFEEDATMAALYFEKAAPSNLIAYCWLAEIYYENPGIRNMDYNERMEKSEYYLNELISITDDDFLVEMAEEKRQEYFGY